MIENDWLLFSETLQLDNHFAASTVSLNVLF